jgi:hypothetical protein
MTNHWAIAIGINQYQYLQPLQFAQQDAQSLCEGLVSEAGFLPEHCILMTDNSPEVVGRSTYPSRDNLQHWIKFFRQEMAQTEDWVWVFFSGYGIHLEGQDYLLPIQGDPRNPAATGVTLRSLFEQLQQFGSERTLVLLDINRAPTGAQEGQLGKEAAELAREFQIPTVLSCRPEEYSHEAPTLGHGLFTAALLEGLRSHQCSTLGSLEDFLMSRLPELCGHHNHPMQYPALIVSDLEQMRQMIMPVNWAEADEWTAAIDNSFTIDSNFFDASVLEADSNLELASYGSVATAFEPVSFPSDSALPATATIAPVSEPILELDAQGDPIAPPRISASKVPTVVPPTVAPAPDQVPDQLFWRRLLIGGGALLTVLVAGVVFRNWAAFSGQAQTPTQPAPASVAPLKAEGQAPPAANPKARSSQALLNEAQALTRPTSATDASKAIELARRIPAGDPLHAQAQQNIDRWSRDILEIARGRAKQKQFRPAVAAAQLVPKDNPQLHAEAQKAIAQWRKAR